MNSFQQLNSRFFVKISVIICNCTVNVVMHFVTFSLKCMDLALGNVLCPSRYTDTCHNALKKSKSSTARDLTSLFFLIMEIQLLSSVHTHTSRQTHHRNQFNTVSMVTASIFALWRILLVKTIVTVIGDFDVLFLKVGVNRRHILLQ